MQRDREPERDAAAWAWTTRMPGAVLAALVWDEDLDADPPPFDAAAEVRPGPDGATRLLCFASGTGSTPADVIVLAVGRRSPHAVRGRLVPGRWAGGTSVALQTTVGDPADTWVDDDGRFSLPWSPVGPLRLVVRRPGAPDLTTAWTLTY